MAEQIGIGPDRRMLDLGCGWGALLNFIRSQGGSAVGVSFLRGGGRLPATPPPGSWLPFGQEQIIRSAEPHFFLVSSTSGRLDYIETVRQWNQRIGAPVS